MIQTGRRALKSAARKAGDAFGATLVDGIKRRRMAQRNMLNDSVATESGIDA